jgi:hypothetical protein
MTPLVDEVDFVPETGIKPSSWKRVHGTGFISLKFY